MMIDRRFCQNIHDTPNGRAASDSVEHGTAVGVQRIAFGIMRGFNSGAGTCHLVSKIVVSARQRNPNATRWEQEEWEK
jgi:hypothetical protein